MKERGKLTLCISETRCLNPPTACLCACFPQPPLLFARFISSIFLPNCFSSIWVPIHKFFLFLHLSLHPFFSWHSFFSHPPIVAFSISSTLSPSLLHYCSLSSFLNLPISSFLLPELPFAIRIISPFLSSSLLCSLYRPPEYRDGLNRGWRI